MDGKDQEGGLKEKGVVRCREGGENAPTSNDSLINAVSTVTPHHREPIALCMTHDLGTHIPILLSWSHYKQNGH